MIKTYFNPHLMLGSNCSTHIPFPGILGVTEKILVTKKVGTGIKCDYRYVLERGKVEIK